jgi:predicted amidohydrolase
MLNIGIIQTKLFWQDKPSNLIWFEEKIDKLSGNPDIIVLPEMFNTGFSMDSEGLSENMNGKTIKWMKKISAEKNSAIVGSLIIKENECYFNRLIWMNPDGSFEYYDKRHLFRMANEHENFSQGKKRLIVDYKGWKICPMICYDLRFPVWSRNSLKNDTYEYDLLIYIANWPERRVHAWQSLLPARAIENQAYVIGVNRIGLDGNNTKYSGDSIALNYLGEKISKIERFGDGTEIVELDKSNLEKFRKDFPAALDADYFSIA